MDESRDLLDGLPHLEIGIPQIHLVADAPDQDGGVVLVLEDLRLELLDLGSDGIFIIVVHPRPFGPDIQAERHGHVIPERRIQKVGLARAPEPDRIGPGSLQQREMGLRPGPKDVVGFPVPLQREAIPVGDDLHMSRPRLRGHLSRAQHDEDKTQHAPHPPFHLNGLSGLPRNSASSKSPAVNRASSST